MLSIYLKGSVTPIIPNPIASSALICFGLIVTFPQDDSEADCVYANPGVGWQLQPVNQICPLPLLWLAS